jgi:hypothetical protein
LTFAGWTLAQLWPLMAAGAAAITALYLLRMRRREIVVPFAELWERVTRRSESRRLWRKLRRLLSWLLQILVLLLLGLALGDPRPEVWLRDPYTVAIVIDRSASMGAPSEADPARTRLALAIERAEQEVAALGPADRAVVIAAGGQVDVTAPLSGDASTLVMGLAALTPSAGEADLTRALALASDAVSGREGARILVLTDGAIDPPGASAIVACVEGPLDCQVAAIAGESENVAITAFAARRYPFARDQIEVLTEVRNLGDHAAEVVLEIDADGASVGRRELTLAPGETRREILPELDAARTRFVARLRRPGGATGPVGLPEDDEAFAVVPPLSPLSVVLVSDGTNLFTEAALLTLDDHIRLSGASPESARLGTAADMEDADVVIFDVGDELLPAELPDAHVVIFDPWRHETSPCPILEKAEVARPYLTEQDVKHALLEHVVLKDINIARGTTFATEPGDQVLVRSLGEPIIVMREGAHATIAIGFDPRQSDFPMRTAYPVLLDNIIRYFEQGRAGFVASVPLGLRREVDLARVGMSAESVTRIRVDDPTGRSVEAPVERGHIYLRALVPGFYTLTSLDGPLAGAVVQLAVNQADTHASDLHDQLGQLDLPEAAAAEAIPSNTDPLGQGPLWTLIIIFAAVLVALEWAAYHRRVTV